MSNDIYQLHQGSTPLLISMPHVGTQLPQDLQSSFSETGLQVDDTDTWYQRAVDAGAISVMAPQDMFWGDRYAQVRDPFGHLWAIGTPLG